MLPYLTRTFSLSCGGTFTRLVGIEISLCQVTSRALVTRRM